MEKKWEMDGDLIACLDREGNVYVARVSRIDTLGEKATDITFSTNGACLIISTASGKTIGEGRRRIEALVE